jgi:biotin carboxyl carrier protein
MTDSDQALDAIARAAADLVPQLTERLNRHHLGEIEVVLGDLRLRVAGGTGTIADPAPADPGVTVSPVIPVATERADPTPSAIGVASPAVGFFVYADGLGPGLPVSKGDELGHVEMLGVRHDVRAPRGGTVRHLIAESGEAVEYGQIVLEIRAEAAAG